MSLIALLYISCNLVLDTNCCNSDFVLIPMQQKIPLFQDGKVTQYIINDTVTENYFIGSVYSIDGEYAYIKGGYAFDTTLIEGWIKTDYIGTYTILDDKIPLYVSPDYGSQMVFIDNPEWYPLKIIKCYSDWIYVHYIDQYQSLHGWLPKEYQCANPYTTCN